MGLLSAIAGMLHRTPPADTGTRLALARIGELVDPLLTVAPDFDSHLKSPVDCALGYCEGLVDSLPGPHTVDSRAFVSDPLVHALFATADDIRGMLGRSQAVRDYLANPECRRSDSFYALLAARRQEKKQLGPALQGDTLRANVPQTVLYFTDHTLVEPHCELHETRQALRASAYDSLLRNFHAHLEGLRIERAETQGDSTSERAHLALLKGSTPGPEYAVHTRRLAELDAHLRSVAAALEPEPLVRALAEFLLAPELSLALQPYTVALDRMGVVTQTAGAGDTLSFPELIARDKRRYMVTLVRVARAQAEEAVASVLDFRHRFVII
ncbi:MAG: hypothetical protein U1E96_06100 [Azonexus sp.]|jgi:hypothetical protein